MLAAPAHQARGGAIERTADDIEVPRDIVAGHRPGGRARRRAVSQAAERLAQLRRVVAVSARSAAGAELRTVDRHTLDRSLPH